MLLGLIVACLFQLATFKAVSAQSPQKVTITPFLQTVTLPAEQATGSFTVTLTNNANATQDFTLSAVDFGSLDETGGLLYAGSDAGTLAKKYELANWLKLSSNAVSIEPGKSAEVSVTIVNDVDLTPGGHYAAIIAEVDAEKITSDNTIQIKQKISSLVFATKTGGEVYKLALNKFTHDGSYLKLPERVVLDFQNKGNVHLVPRGTVSVKNASGEVLLKGVINEASSYVLPDQSRQVTAELSKVDSRYVLPGKYRVEVMYRYDGYETAGFASESFFFISWAVVAAALIICSGTVYAVRSRTHKKHFRKNRK